MAENRSRLELLTIRHFVNTEICLGSFLQLVSVSITLQTNSIAIRWLVLKNQMTRACSFVPIILCEFFACEGHIDGSKIHMISLKYLLSNGSSNRLTPFQLRSVDSYWRIGWFLFHYSNRYHSRIHKTVEFETKTSNSWQLDQQLSKILGTGKFKGSRR